MELTPEERPVVCRAVEAYRLSKKGHKGPFKGTTPDQILEELELSPARWSKLASFVIDSVEGRDARVGHGGS